MTDIDLSRLPTGGRGWAALVAWAAASDDRLERYFLELKSDVDLTTKEGRQKVAKFILGAANRDPAKAGKRFAGHALLLLGVGRGTATGIPPFEAQHLEREVLRFAGAGGPGWDYEQIPIDDGHDVIAIVVDPPTGRIWPCLADGIGMANGDIYLRGDGKTEKATGAEITVMLDRFTLPGSTLPDLAVELSGEILAIRLDRDRLTAWIEETTREYLEAVDTPTSLPFGPFGGTLMETRSRDDFRRKVQRWRESAMARPEAGVAEMAARISKGIRFRITNPVKVPLRDVRIDIDFETPVQAIDSEERDDDQGFSLFPDRPIEWGRGHSAALIMPVSARNFAFASNSDGALNISQSSPARLTLSLDLLRPEEDFVSDIGEVVLIAHVDAETHTPITARWRITSGDVHDALDGTVSIPVDYRDWTEAVAHLAGDR